jgi:hypothetical protein
MTNSLVSKLKRFSLFPLAIILVLSSSVFIDQKAYADDHDEKIRKWALFEAQDGESGTSSAGCFDGIDSIDFRDVKTNGLGGDGFSKERIVLGKKMSCAAIYEEGISKWGFSGAEDFLTAAGYKKNNGNRTWEATKGRQGPVNAAIRSKLKINDNNIEEYLKPGEIYTYYYKDFVSTCSVKDEKNRSELNSSQITLADKAEDGYISYSRIGKDGNSDIVQQVIAKYKAPDITVTAGNHSKTEEDKKFCIDKSKRVTAQASKAIDNAKKNASAKAVDDSLASALSSLKNKACAADQSKCNDNGWEKSVAVCIANATKSYVTEAVVTRGKSSKEKDINTYKKEYISKCMHEKWPNLTEKEIKDILNGVDTKKAADAAKAGDIDIGGGEGAHDTPEDGEEESKSRCAIDGVGWVVCPVVNFLADISDDSAGILAKLLEVNSFILTNRGPDSAFHYWSRIRDIANIVFVIVFLIIIYSQVSGLGISNYGIKKLLPKLLMTIVLVNISFYICSILVDISNIVGSSSFNFITSLGGGGSGPEGGWATKGNALGGIAAAVLAGTVGFFALGALISGLIFIAVTATVTVFLLGARHALVIFTIILSPLAFVALLLPSTEGLFKKWWGFFKTLLFLYPAVGLLYGACNLGATVINGMKGESEVLLQIIAAALTFTPLLLVSRLTSLMTSMMGLANIADKWGQMAGNAVGKKSQKMLNDSKWGKYMDYRDQVKAERRAQIQAGTYKGTKNPATWGRAARSWVSGKANRVIEVGANKFNNEAAKRMIEDLGKEASWQEEKRYDESIKKAKTMYESDVSFIDSGTGYKTRLGNSQFVDMARGLVNPNIKPTDSAGNVITSIPMPQTTSERRYILDRAGRSANAEQFVQLAELANSLQSEGERLALASALSTSSGAKKHGWFDGGAYNDIKDGKFDLQQSIVRSINKEKFGKPEEIANMDQASARIINEALSEAGPRVSGEVLKQAQDRIEEAAQIALQDERFKNEILSRQSIRGTVDDWSAGKFKKPES